MRTKHKRAGFALLLVLIIFNACTNSVEPSEEHFEASGLYLISSQDTIVKYEKGIVEGKMEAETGLSTQLVSVLFVKDDGSLGLPPNDEWSFDWQVADTSIAKVVEEEDIVDYSFRMRGIKKGQTAITIILKHHDHKDFESLPIPIDVNDPVILPKIRMEWKTQ